MILTRHCDLCDNQKTSLKIGTTCGLNDRRPEFNKTCSKIALNDKFLNKLEDANLELNAISKIRNKVHITFYLLIIVGILLIIGSSALAEWTHNRTYFWYYKISTIGLGISIFIGAFYNLNEFRRKFKNAEHKKNSIDEVLDEYGISYESNIVYKEKVHESQEIEVLTEFKNWKKTHHNTGNRCTSR
ncbi:hypothetical protein [uncultured Zobellia sp.]|uniref:hypothetical protein n=1 Tax=uncultured Zobellia sp. TaxID=255433 RepID=UPI0025946FEC|nr:hypothetical protein [uncultured Zobellia sp.]